MVGGTAGDMQWHSRRYGGVACLIIVSLQVLDWALDLDLDTGPDLELDNIIKAMVRASKSLLVVVVVACLIIVSS